MKNLKTILQKNLLKVGRLELELILAFLIGKDRTYLLSHPEHQLSTWQYIKLKYYLFLVKRNWPVAYITHRKEFYGLDFYVDRSVLVPRPETELLVEEAIKIIEKKKEATLVDVGTGSGCIPIAINKSLSEPVKTIAIDISKPVLAVAKRNAEQHKVNIDFLQSNLLENYHSPLPTPHSLVITANLPYLTTDQYHDALSIRWEPKQALVAADQGLEYYEKLVKQVAKLRRTGQRSIALLMEIDPGQTKKLTDLIKKDLPSAKIEVRKDLAGRERVVVCQA